MRPKRRLRLQRRSPQKLLRRDRLSLAPKNKSLCASIVILDYFQEARLKRPFRNHSRGLKNVIGYRKEIDHALERIAAIEKHLGISPQARLMLM
jgi:hypothetical protein